MPYKYIHIYLGVNYRNKKILIRVPLVDRESDIRETVRPECTAHPPRPLEFPASILKISFIRETFI